MYIPAREQVIGLSRNTFSKKGLHMGIMLIHRKLDLIFIGISGTSELLRTSDFGVVYTK